MRTFVEVVAVLIGAASLLVYGAPSAAEDSSPIWPARLRIPAINVDAAMEDLNMTREGELRPPIDPDRAGWFPDSAVPGELGSAVIAGHRDSTRGPAVLFRLIDLRPGDIVHVTRSDGVEVQFEVVEVRRVPQDEFPTASVYGATPDSSLRLITCGGVFDRVSGRYRDNVLVLALKV